MRYILLSRKYLVTLQECEVQTMNLNNYQREVMDDLSKYLSALNETGDLFKAWQKYWNDKDIAVGFGGVPAYRNGIKDVPHICMKVRQAAARLLWLVQLSAVFLMSCRPINRK